MQPPRTSQNNMKYKKLLISLLFLASLSGLQACSSWIYRIDVPQGNYLSKDDVGRLRIDMTKEQVVYILGHPVVNDPFNQDEWYYLYTLKKGSDGKKIRKQLILDFKDGKLADMSGDFEKPKNFNTPLEQ